MTTVDVQKKLATPELSDSQISLTDIPRTLFERLTANKITPEVKTETKGEIRLWCQLPTNSSNKTHTVVAIFTELDDGDAITTKFALMRWYPNDEHFRNSYEFEIYVEPRSKGWSLSEGNRFVETLLYSTKANEGHPLIADHPIVDYIALAFIEMSKLLKNHALEIVRQEFVDNALESPR